MTDNNVYEKSAINIDDKNSIKYPISSMKLN